MDDITVKFLTLIMLSVVISGILMVIFRFTTYRKLKKNPETSWYIKNHSFGLVTYDTAQDFAFPIKLLRKIYNKYPFFDFYRIKLYRKHTNCFDHVLGVLCYWTWTLPSLLVIGYLVLDSTGLIDTTPQLKDNQFVRQSP